MSADTELEIKLAVPDPNLWGKLLADPDIQAMQVTGTRQTRSFEAIYYDTANLSLQKAGIAYRLRREGEEWVATAKCDKGSGGGLFSREELNEKIAAPDPSVSCFAGTHLGERMALLLGDAKLQLLFSTKFERTTVLLKTGNNSLVELAMDRGMIWGGLTGIPISELELELKDGCVSDLLKLAGWVAGQFHLQPEPLSKYARGMALLDPGWNERKNTEIFMHRLEPCGLLTACIGEVFSAQSAVLRAEGDLESIKDLRMQIRKLRSLLKFFQPFLRREEGEAHKEKLREWGELLGGIRDFDVLQAAWVDFAETCKFESGSSGTWQDLIVDRREFFAATVLYRLGRAELTRSLFELQAWLMQTDNGEGSEGVPSEGHVRKAFMRLVQELRREIGEMQGIPTIRQLHALRIRTKRLRYLLESISTVPGYRDEVLIAALKKMQNLLGKIHDVYQIQKQLEKISANKDAATIQPYQVQLFIGWRSRDMLKNLFSLPAALEEFRKSAKIYLRALASLRGGSHAKASHDAGPHEPLQ